MRRNIEGEGFRCTSNFSKGLKLFKIKLGGKVKPPRLLWREPNMRRTGRQGPSCPTPPADWGSVLGLGPSSVALPQWPPEVLCAHGRLALGQSVKLWTQKKSPSHYPISPAPDYRVQGARPALWPKGRSPEVGGPHCERITHSHT